MKKKIALLLTMSLTAGVLGMMTGCGSSSEETTKESSVAESTDETQTSTIDVSDVEFISDGVLTMGCDANYPPFETIAEDGTTPIGYDIDVMTEVANRLGLELNVVNTGWDGIFEGIDVNYDVVCSGVTITEERKESMLFSDSYITNYQTVVVPAGSDLKIESLNDLDGKTIAVQKETTSDIVMSDLKSTNTIDVNIVQNEKVTACFTQLTNGEIDAVVCDSSVADSYVASQSDVYEIAYKDKEEAEVFGIAMGINNTKLQAAINQALADMEADGWLEETRNYWFGDDTE
ncbi:transporter substrate-binding domain-containing protein [Eubacterium oxidoreducens]|uniref:Polar amino acid transport system substrate-binding protein n=1 Tax=Eubacterium oxidoreducens TaxID=1732 RepID=A0A1G6ABA5_EUBOX|nr:transporter substrate-binding domain-containing protein [Eubacterium oxidoreducens]SDB05688.1 polar amino acid transport system substrate-binding protein [Eubacterium oxidoreducens]